MVAVEQPRADCGHAAALTQHCGRCLRWCCPECYAPWTALACGDCRAEAAGALTATSRSAIPASEVPTIEGPTIEVAVESATGARCRERSGSRVATGRHRERDRAKEPADVATLAARVADLERRLAELRFGS